MHLVSVGRPGYSALWPKYLVLATTTKKEGALSCPGIFSHFRIKQAIQLGVIGKVQAMVDYHKSHLPHISILALALATIYLILIFLKMASNANVLILLLYNTIFTHINVLSKQTNLNIGRNKICSFHTQFWFKLVY